MLTEPRLVGVWRSDKRRTLLEILPRLDGRSRKARLFRTIFGRLALRFTRHRIHSEFKGRREVHPYRVLGRDSSSVAIFAYRKSRADGSIQHIHFEGDRYWVSIGPYREFFRRVGPKPRRRRPRPRKGDQ